MNFQKVLKGINGLDDHLAQDIVDNGIMSSWWRKAGTISPKQIKDNLNINNLDLHLNHYHKPVPVTNPLHHLHTGKFGDITPFISTTAGAITRDSYNKRNITFPPFITALNFATKNSKSDGYIFYAYLMTVGKVAVEMEQFSEEIRNLYVYTDFQPYYHQGEITAKILIPSVQIEKVEGYKGSDVKVAHAAGTIPTPSFVYINPSYQRPENLSNIQEVI
ncbi:hypothetical protein [Chryseobacterium daeguense]|uniref:hypothetical protein n=1 Tax=Chryseobacterium daeguense TaxID=412438 RepID=UPI00040AA7F8|nr:hypothetical protein [Chryseobacterium daeguense]